MDDQILRGLVCGLIGGISAGIILYVWALLQPQRYCPDCQKELPKVGRKGRDGKGGWICQHCGCKVDPKGIKRAV